MSKVDELVAFMKEKFNRSYEYDIANTFRGKLKFWLMVLSSAWKLGFGFGMEFVNVLCSKADNTSAYNVTMNKLRFLWMPILRFCIWHKF